MNRNDSIKYLLQKPDTRIKLLEHDLFLFGLYYFTPSFKSPSADFHKEWCKAFLGKEHLLIIAFRESAKTLWAMIKFIHNICYQKKRFQMYYCYDGGKSASRLYDIALHLQTNKKIISDFGRLFPGSVVKNVEQESQKKSIGNFITTNGIQCKAMSIGLSPRGEVFFHRSGTYRPDAIFLDDIDVDKSVSSVNMIEKTYLWIKGEMLGGLSDTCQIIFLGNVIKNDGIVLRFESDYATNNQWKIYRKALIENGEITWNRYSWDDVEAKRKMLGEISFNQNMLLIPYSGGDSIIKRHQILYRHYDTWDKIIIGADPAISEKSMSDDFAIVVTAYIGKYKNIKAGYTLKGTEKNPYNAVQFIKNLYTLWKAKAVNVEIVAFQQVMATLLKSENIAVNEIRPSRDKVTRLMEKQAEFEQGFVSFDPEGEGIKQVVDQLINFPNIIHDDLVDALVYSLDDKTPEIFIGSF